jgi:uncharacterized protein DUF6894
MKKPRYHFVVQAPAPDHNHDDPDGMVLSGPNAAKEHARRVVRELKEGGYDPEGATLIVLDESGKTIHSVAF